MVANSRTNDLTQPTEPEIYLSFWQNSAFSKHLVIRSASDPRAIMSSVRAELRSIDPTVAVENVKTLDQIRGDSLASRSFATQLLAGFSLVGSLLTLVGIYGVLSLSVASRRREIAIRSAVGAQAKDIRNLIFGEGFRLIAGGDSHRELAFGAASFGCAPNFSLWCRAYRSCHYAGCGIAFRSGRDARVLGSDETCH